ncbi:O-acyltransferase [Macleaya cordata]|uniref:O-acyltransferase n=1 Tax=Macleaya cordata TaxID=56857 RepID=A0A200RDZ1_MACCD|nr:O-acyltransferase [Macleaya cordata]
MSEMDGIHLLPPLSPLGSFINTPTLTFYILGVLELENPFTKSQTLQFLKDVFIPINIRFSSVIVTDEKGVQRWKKIDSVPEHHLIVPTFSHPYPTSNDQEFYDEQIEEYISDINMKELPQNLPPWQVHLITYPTKNAAGSLIFKLNHALGDGYSIMGALFSIFRRAENPSHPLRFPSASSRMNEVKTNYSRVSALVTKCKNTLSDLTKNVLGAYILKDGLTVIRSTTDRVEHQPISISSVTISLDHIRDIRSRVGGTVNDVTTGWISYGLHLYMKKLGESGDGSSSLTALVVMNMRMYRGFKSIEEMLKANIWGNYFGLLSVSLPFFVSSEMEQVDPLDYIVKAKEEMERKANSYGAYFTSKLLNIVGKLRGPEGGAKFIYSNVRNKTIMISNMCGPVEKAAIAGNPLRSFYFTISGMPQPCVYYSKLHGKAKVGDNFGEGIY